MSLRLVWCTEQYLGDSNVVWVGYAPVLIAVQLLVSMLRTISGTVRPMSGNSTRSRSSIRRVCSIKIVAEFNIERAGLFSIQTPKYWVIPGF